MIQQAQTHIIKKILQLILFTSSINRFAYRALIEHRIIAWCSSRVFIGLAIFLYDIIFHKFNASMRIIFWRWLHYTTFYK